MNNFWKDYREKGKPCEEAVIKILRGFTPIVVGIEGYDKEKDIVANFGGEDKMFEVKNCNLAEFAVTIETKINGKPSGINVTKADYWVIYTKNAYHFIKLEVLKALVKDLVEKESTIDGKQVWLKKLSIEKLKRGSHKIITVE